MDKNKIYFVVFLLWNFSAIWIVTWGGLHQVDLGYNFKGFSDCNSFNCMSMENRYSFGIDGIIIAFFMLIFEIILLFLLLINNQKLYKG